MNTAALSLSILTAACGVQDITPKLKPRHDLPQPQFTVSTYWLSNNPTKPQTTMLRAAARFCDLPPKTVVPNSAAYGIAGMWLLDFACAK